MGWTKDRVSISDRRTRRFFFQRLQIGFGAKSFAYLVGTENNSPWNGGQAMKLITDLYLVPRLRTCGAITLIPSCLHGTQRDNFAFRAVRIHTRVFWVIISCSLSVGTNDSEEHSAFIFRIESSIVHIYQSTRCLNREDHSPKLHVIMQT